MLPIVAGIIASLVQNQLPKLANAVAEKGLSYVEDKLGVKLEPQMTPEAIAEVRELANKHEEFSVNANLENTKSARGMQEVALQQDDVFSKRFVYYLATFWSVVTTVYLFCITFFPMQEAGIGHSQTTVGFLLGTVVATILNYFLGSTLNSHKKTELLAKKD